MSKLQADDTPLDIDDSKPFANATRRLIRSIDYNPYDVARYQSFLASFGRHVAQSLLARCVEEEIIENYDSALKFYSANMDALIATLPDMEPPR